MKRVYYKLGERVGGLLVLHQENLPKIKAETCYIVVTTCCGYFRRISHAAIQERKRKRSSYCAFCRGERKQKYSESEHIEIYPTDWPVPPSSLAFEGHWIWEDGGGR